MPNSAVKPLILVVEDDPAVRNLIVAALEAHGLRHGRGDRPCRHRRCLATMDGEELHLTPIEYKLLCLLAHNADKVLTHQFILHEIWGTATKSDLASLRVFMGTLRKKIESDPAHPRYIQTHVGIGYRLVIQG